MAAPARKPSAAAAVQAIAARLEPSVARAFLEAVEKLKGRISIAELSLAAQRGGLTPAITAALDRWPADLRAAVDLVNDVFAKSGARAATARGLRLSTSFDLTSPFAVAATRRTAFLVREVTAETKEAIRGAIRAAIVDGLPPHVAARTIKPLIGLTRRSATAALRYRASLLAEGATVKAADIAAKRYAERLLRRRAITIARTETIRASVDGQLALWEQARADGLLPGTVRKRWSTARDERVCPTCGPLDGVEVLLSDPFPGGVHGPPRHPMCRCSLVLATTPGRPRSDAEILTAPSSTFTVVEPQGTDTLARYSDPSGLLSPERQRLHDAIIEAELTKATPVANPSVQVMGGGPASGKSTIVSQVDLPSNALTIDVDALRTRLPEYREGLARQDPAIASFTHEEVSLIGKKLSAKASARHYNLILDGTGDGSLDNLERKLASYRAKGMPIHGQYVTVDTDIAVARAQTRGQRTGRFVPESYIRETHKGVSAVLPTAIERGLFDTVTLWDTNTPAPVKVMSAVGRRITVHDQTAWARFLAKANE